MIQDNIHKKPLGKGLSALLSQNSTLNHLRGIDESNSGFSNIPLNQIEPNPYQPRRIFANSELEELKDSIATYGIIQPIILRRKGSKYQIIAGERRWRASQLLNLSTIPAVIKDVNDQETFELALIENIQRQNLSPIEEANSYEKLIKEYKYTHELVAKKVGKSRSYITNLIRLLSLPESVKKLIDDQQISVGHARALINAKNPEELAKKIVDEQWSVRKIEDEIKDLHDQIQSNESYKSYLEQKKTKYKNQELVEIEQMLSQSLNLPVEVKDSPKGGHVIINFTKLEELDLIIQKLSASHLNF